MKGLCKFLFFTVVYVFILSCASIQAAEQNISVYLNGEELIYDDAQPQIINSRAMVPVRKTADYLGMNTEWNAKTETMTFTKGDRVIVHTMRSNVVYVNGEAIQFDTPSANIKNRTMMPIRMLAEAMGAEVEWDNNLRRVVITTGNAEVLSASIDKTAINSGDTAVITVITNSNAEKVKLVDTADISLVNETSVYADNSSGTRTFTLNWSPSYENATVKTLRAYSGTATGYNEATEATKTIVATISPIQKAKLKSYYADDYSVEKNEYVTLKIYTSDSVERVKVTNSFSTSRSESNKYTLSGNDRVFEVKTKMSKKGNVELYIYVGGSDGYDENYETVSIKVGVDKDDDYEDEDELEIIDVEPVEDVVAVGQNAVVNITTTTDITEVAIYDEDDKRIARTSYTYSKSSKEYVWQLEFEVSSSGKERYTVKAFTDDDDVVKDTFRIEGERYSNSELYIINIEQKSEGVEVGDKVRFNAITTSVADYIVIKDSSGNEVEKITDSNDGGWSFYVKLESKTRNTFTLYAYDAKGNVVSKKFNVQFEEKEEVEILDIEVESKTVDIDEDIQVTIYTDKTAEKVWIEDEDGVRVAKSSRYDNSTSNKLIWELTFSMEDEGKYTFTAFAQNEDKETDEYTFKITVED